MTQIWKDLRSRVVCAAVRYPDGTMLIGPRHFDSVMQAQRRAHGSRLKGELYEEGFIDQFGTFMTREEAHVVATQKNQFFRRCPGDEQCLYSENLY